MGEYSQSKAGLNANGCLPCSQGSRPWFGIQGRGVPEWLKGLQNRRQTGPVGSNPTATPPSGSRANVVGTDVMPARNSSPSCTFGDTQARLGDAGSNPASRVFDALPGSPPQGIARRGDNPEVGQPGLGSYASKAWRHQALAIAGHDGCGGESRRSREPGGRKAFRGGSTARTWSHKALGTLVKRQSRQGSNHTNLEQGLETAPVRIGVKAS